MDMNRTTATKPSSPRSDAPRAFNEMAEKGATQTKETYESNERRYDRSGRSH